MRWAEIETHVRTHVELSARYVEGGKFAVEIYVETFFGEGWF